MSIFQFFTISFQKALLRISGGLRALHRLPVIPWVSVVVVSIFVLSFQLLVAPSAHAADGIRKTINFQGKLVDQNGLNVPNGSYTVVFTLYDDPSVGSNLWDETQSVTTTDGVFQVELGTVDTTLGNVNFNSDLLYLGIKVGTDAEMTPRIRFTAVPYAFNAEKVGGITGLQVANGFTFDGGTTTPASVSFTKSGGILTIQPGDTSGLTLDTGSAATLNIGTTNATSMVLGSSTLGGLTVTTNGTGDSEVQLPDQSIGANEIVNDTIDYAQIADSATLDADSTVSLSGYNYILDLTSVGEFFVRDAGNDFAQFLADGTITLGKVASSGSLNLGVGTGADTVNIGTNNTVGDTITVGNNNASTTLGLTGGDDWSITTAGAASFASLAGAGLIDCDSATSKLLWNDASGQFSCGVDMGSNLQVVSFTDSTTEVATFTSALNLWDGTYPNITPGSTDSKILVSVNIRGTSDDANDHNPVFTIRRNIGTNPSCTDTQVGGEFVGGFLTTTGQDWGASVTFSDAPSSTGNVRYTVCTATTGLDDANSDVITVTLTEIGSSSGGGSGGSMSVRETDSSPSVSSVSTLEFGPATTSSDEFIVTDEGSGIARVRIGNQVAMLNEGETVNGGWIFDTAVTTFTTALNANGGISTSATDQDLMLAADGAGNVIFNVDGDSLIAIGTTLPEATFDVRGQIGTLPVASFSGQTSYAGLAIDNSGVGDLFTASKSGVPTFTITNSGAIIASNYQLGGGILFSDNTGTFSQTTAGNIGECLQSTGGGTPTWGPCGTGGGSTAWDVLDGVIAPKFASTVDLLLGGTATSSAKFGVLNINNGTPTATLSATTTGNALSFTADGTITTTQKQTLTVGGGDSGDVYIASTLNLDATLGVKGGGLSDCANATTSKLLWDASTNRFSCGTDQGGGGASDLAVFDAYDNTGGDNIATGLTVNLDTVRKNSDGSIYSLSGDVLTINETGTYMFQFRVGATLTAGTRGAVRAYLEEDSGGGFTEVEGSRGYAYGRITTYPEATAVGFLTMDVTAGDQFRLRALVEAATFSTVPDGSSLVVTKVDGLSGGGGGGSSLTVRESDSSSAVSAVAALEFGPGSASSDEFVVTDEGLGVARVRLGNQVGILNQAGTVTGGWTFNTTATTFSTGIVADGGISTTADTDLSLAAAGTGNVIFSVDPDSGVIIGSSANTPAPLSVSGGIGNNAAFIVNQENDGNIIAASSGGQTRFTVDNSGNITTSGGLTFANAESITNGTDGTITFGRNDGGTIEITAQDNDSTAALYIHSGGAADLTLDTGGNAGLSIATTNASTVTIGHTANGTSVSINTGTGGLNLGDNANTKAIEIGGVDNDGADTIRIGTNATSPDTITIGNGNAATTLSLTSGTGWSITGAGVANFSQVEGAGLTDCDTSTAKLQWDDANNVFSCGTDNTGGVQQVVYMSDATNTTWVDNNTTELWNAATQPNITPSSNTSELLLMVSVRALLDPNSTSADTAPAARIDGETNSTADCADTNTVGASFGYTWNTDTATNTIGSTLTYITVDAPATTQNRSYTVCTSSDSILAGVNTENRIDFTIMEVDDAADLAEIYPTNDATLAPGDIVALDPEMQVGVKKSSKAYDKNSIGVVSTVPALVIGGTNGESDKGVPVALAGRVPVKISTENGPIKKGDVLTSSSIPGVAAKAIKAGTMIGIALGDYDESSIGVVMMFVKMGNFTGLNLKEIVTGPIEGSDIHGESATILNHFVKLKEEKSEVSDISEIFTDRVVAGLSIIAPTVTTDELQVNRITSANNSDIGLQLIGNGQFILQNASGSAVALFDGSGNASFSGTLTADMLQVNRITMSSDAWKQAFTEGGLVSLGEKIIEQEFRIAQLEKKLASSDTTTVDKLASLSGILDAEVSKVTQERTLGDDVREASKLVVDSVHVTGSAIIEGIVHVVDTLTVQDLIVDNLATFLSKVVFSGEVIFEDHPTFNNDTAGIAIVKKGIDRVEVRFEKEYKAAPMVNVNLTLDEVSPMPGEAIENLVRRQEALEDRLLGEDIRYIVTKRTAKGFVILLDDKADEDIAFSWIVVAVDNPLVRTINGDNSPAIKGHKDENTRPISSDIPTIIPTSSIEKREIEILPSPKELLDGEEVSKE